MVNPISDCGGISSPDQNYHWLAVYHFEDMDEYVAR